jgi:hypothetical protein
VIDRSKRPETYTDIDGYERRDDDFRYIVEDGNLWFGPFETPEAALAWARRRAELCDETALIPRGLNARICPLKFPGKL